MGIVLIGFLMPLLSLYLLFLSSKPSLRLLPVLDLALSIYDKINQCFSVCFIFTACQRIVQMRYPSAPSAVVPAGVVPSTPNHSQRSFYVSQTSNSGGKPGDTHSLGSQSTSSSGTLVTTGVSADSNMFSYWLC